MTGPRTPRTVRASRSAAARSLRLLSVMWTPEQPVGRTGARLDTVVATATAIADAEGLEAVTMRRVAEAVGVGTMTLYGYVPGRAELVELMLDAWSATTYTDHPLPGECDGWREAITHVAQRNWEHRLAHPWVVEVPPERPILGPGVCVKYDRELAAVDGIGLPDLDMDHLLTTVLGLVDSAARWQVGLDRVREQSGLTDDQWWALSGPSLAEAMSGLELPVASRVGESVASVGTPHGSMRWALVRLLDGVAERLP